MPTSAVHNGVFFSPSCAVKDFVQTDAFMSDLSSPPPDGDVNRGQVLLIVGWLESALALVFLCGRLYVRIKINRSVGLDDWAMIVAYVSWKPVCSCKVFVCAAEAQL